MTVASAEEMSLRTYLLGGLPLDEQMRIEERLLLDGDYVELLLIVEEDLIEGYLGGTLPKRELVQFEKHFLTTPARRRKLRRAKALRRYVNNAHSVSTLASEREPKLKGFWWQRLFAPAWQAALAAFLMLALGVGGWRIFLFQSLADKGRAALQAALRESPSEARIAGFDWPPQRVTLGDQPGNIADQTSLDSAERYLLDAVTSQRTPDAHYALGQLYLAKKDFDLAIKQFESALEGDPKNAKLHSDLGAALMEKGRASQEKGSNSSLQDFDRSLTHLNEALALDGSLLEALFNRALCHEHMQVPSQAEADWQEYLKRDSNSRWADEARRHLKEITDNRQNTSQTKGELLQGFLSAYRAGDGDSAWKLLSGTREVITGRLIWWQLLDVFFNSTGAGQLAEANEILQALRYVGNLDLHHGRQQEQSRGDPYVAELESFYRSSSPQRRDVLAEAHRLMNEGNGLYSEGKHNEAFSRYGRAREIFKSADDGWEVLLADYMIGNCLIQRPEVEQSLSLFNQLVKDCENKRYLWLLGESLFSLAMVHDSRAEHSKALANTIRALQISEDINDLYNIQRCLAQIADQYKKLANYELATTYLNLCLKQISAAWPGGRQMWRNYDQLVQVLAARRLYAAAADYASEALAFALGLKDSSFIYVSYVHLAIIRWKQQDHAEALRLAELGFETAPNSGYHRAYASLQLGHLHRQAGDLRRALYDYDRSNKYIDEAEQSANAEAGNQAPQLSTERLHALRYDAHKGRLFCLFAEGSHSEVEAELKTTLELLEKHRETIREEQNRNTFFDAEQSVYDAAIEFEYSLRGNAQAAFDYSEKSRARSLLDMMSTGAQVAGAEAQKQTPSQPQSLPEVQRRMPDKTQLIEYAVLDDKLLICLVTKSEFLVREVPIRLSELSDKVINFRYSILHQGPEALSQAQELYNLLIDPIKLSPYKGEQICFVPDKVLSSLPFAVLVSPASNRYLVEDYQLTLAPSATIYLACSERNGHKTDRNSERLLAVGNPSFDRSVFTLPALPSTRKQVESIAEFYSSPVVLTEDNARKNRVKYEMEKSDVIQIASHYVVYEGSPMNSRLVLAQEPGVLSDPAGASGSLQADEVRGLQLRGHAPLVVLSACQSGVERYYNGEGMIGMARGFLAAGAPVVVASLWQVEAHATDELMVNFHKRRKSEGLSSASALTQAQRDMLGGHSGRQYQHPYYWAGFIPIGGHTDF